jgi:hypothetical protein
MMKVVVLDDRIIPHQKRRIKDNIFRSPQTINQLVDLA